MQWWTIPNHMELAPYAPEYDEPEVEPSEILDVVFGRADHDSLGRDYDELMNKTAMGEYHDAFAFNERAEKRFFRVIGENWDKFPQEVRKVFEELATKAAEGDK